MKLFSILVFLALVSCSPIGLAKALLPGNGVDVNTNAQIGKTNNQTIGPNQTVNLKTIKPVARSFDQSVGDKKIQAETVKEVIIQEKDSIWLILAFAGAVGAGMVGWLTPSPRERKLQRQLYQAEARLTVKTNASHLFLDGVV